MRKVTIARDSVQEITAQFAKMLESIIQQSLEVSLKNSTPEKTIIGIAEACERYQISRATLSRLMSSGSLKVHQISKRKFLYIDELENVRR